ncbi:MAG: sterol desaturase family protein [Bacteroidetes bacterium]|nr:sterol desaturase family protein [Bacteroidota bacterium]
MGWEKFFEVWMRIAGNITMRYLGIAGVVFLIFYVLLKKPMQHRRIQPLVQKWKNYRRDIGFSLLTVVLFATIASLVFVVWRPYTQLFRDPLQYGWGYLVLSFPMMLLIHDAYFYWVHRIMHHPKLYKRIHHVHHLSTNPSPWTAYAFHPLEAILEAGIIPLIAFTLPVSQQALGYFLLFQFVYNVYGHLGYELYPKNFHKHWLGKWINTGTAHNQHHQYFHGNYGLYTLIWDRLFGTLRPDNPKKYEEVTKNS